MASVDIPALVASVLADRPLPADVGDLDDGGRKALDAAARRQGVEPAALLSVLRARRAKAAADGEAAQRIALDARAAR